MEEMPAIHSNTTRGIWREAAKLFSSSWRSLFLSDLSYKAIAFAVLTPATALFLRWILSRTGADSVSDAGIAMFFFTTPQGIVALLLGGEVVIAITAVECASLMVIALAAALGIHINARGALRSAASKAPAVLRLTLRMVIRIVLGLVPFAIAGGGVYFTLLRNHDINFYLARKPPEFLIAGV